jgi:hypothetical protein
MLIKYSVNNSKFYSSSEILPVKSVSHKNFDKREIEIEVEGIFPLQINTPIKLRRELDDGNYFEERFNVYFCRCTSTSTFITIGHNIVDYCYVLSPYEINKGVIYNTADGTTLQGAELFFNHSCRHILIEDRGGVKFTDVYGCGETIEDIKNSCTTDILYCDKIYYKYNKPDTLIVKNIGVDGTDIKNVTKSTIKKLFVPFHIEGYDNRYALLIIGNETDSFDLNDSYTIKDCRFFKPSNTKPSVHPNTKLIINSGTISFNIPISNNIGTDLIHDVLLEDKLNDEKDNYATKTLDYERVVYTPTEQGQEYLKIRFNIFLRTRHFFEELQDWVPSVIEGEEWVKSDEAMWNIGGYENVSSFSASTNDFKLNEVGKKVNKQGDLLGDIGFLDNDVFNRNKRLAKSFIRLLFFDSKDRGTQTLLYYSTIFLNTSDMYAKYMNNIIGDKQLISGVTRYVSNYVQDDENLFNITCNFECSNKIYSGSTEGFYLHMFPMFVDKEEGNTKQIYMRIEFNHAKYGKTIPLVVGRKNDKNVYAPRYNYTVERRNGAKKGFSTDLTSLYDDMYIPITLFKDTNTGKYCWKFTNEISTSPIFNMFEPKIR